MSRRTFAGIAALIVSCACLSAWQDAAKKTDTSKGQVQEARVSGLVFRLQQCRHETSTVTCDFSVASPQGDTAVNFYSKNFLARNGSRIVTSESTEFIADSVRLAGKEIGSSSRTTLVTGNVADGQIAVNNVAHKPAKISLLSIRGTRTTDKGAGDIVFDAQFRNIVLQ